MIILETLYDLNPDFSLYSHFKLNEFDLSEKLKDVIKNDFETYAKMLKSTKNS